MIFLFVFYYNLVCKTVKLTKGYFLFTLTVAPKLVGILIQNFFIHTAHLYCTLLIQALKTILITGAHINPSMDVKMRLMGR